MVRKRFIVSDKRGTVLSTSFRTKTNARTAKSQILKGIRIQKKIRIKFDRGDSLKKLNARLKRSKTFKIKKVITKIKCKKKRLQ